jgi:Predicted acetyltransferase
MGDDMEIRQETQKDETEIYALIKTAFETAKMPPDVPTGDEQDYAVRLRQSENYVPGLALVAEQNGALIGQVMLTKTTISDGGTDHDALLLGPVSVLLEYRDKGIGGALIQEALKRAREQGHKSVLLAGNPQYYSRFGFRPVELFGLECPAGTPGHLRECIMGCELVPGALDNISGTVSVQ